MSRDEREPHSAEDDHTEGDEFGLVEGVGQLAAQEGEEEAEGRQQADVAQDQVEPSGPRFPALHHYLVARKKNVSVPGFHGQKCKLDFLNSLIFSMQIENMFSLQLCFII